MPRFLPSVSLGQRQMMTAAVGFSFMGVVIKFLPHLHFMQLVFVRSLVGLALCFTFLRLRKRSFKPYNTTVILLRGVFGTTSLSLFFFALYHLPLATATVLQNLTPIFGLFVSAWISNEKVPSRQWIFFILGFVGVVLVRGFGSEISGVGVAAATTSAFFSALAHQMIRKAEKKEDPFRILFYFSLVASLATFPFAMMNWSSPSAVDWGWLIVLGVVTFASQILMTEAYLNEKIHDVSQFNFFQVLLAAALGILIFDEQLGLISILGMGVIVLGVYLSIKFKGKAHSRG